PPAADSTPRALPGTGARTVGSTAFLERLLVRDPTTGSIYLARRVGANVVPVGSTEVASGFDPNTHDGWFFDFPTGGEAVIASPVNRQTFMLFTTVRPAGDESQSCSVAPLASVYALSPVSGLPVPGLFRQVNITNADGTTTTAVNPYGVDSNDQRVINVSDGSVRKLCTDGTCVTDATSVCPPGKMKTRRLGASTDANMCAPANQLRIQWREIPGMRTQ
ncbi:hypothetical protein, partial [uncultured Aquabacterium sp.]|uniref:hypothetical protein n=1 Tax=uncultured Aquabacterium sp. TaxID=158753 RepID=UPI0026170C05